MTTLALARVERALAELQAALEHLERITTIEREIDWLKARGRL